MPLIDKAVEVADKFIDTPEEKKAFIKEAYAQEIKDREAARAIQQTLSTKANDHLTFGYFEKAIVNFHLHLAKYLDG